MRHWPLKVAATVAPVAMPFAVGLGLARGADASTPFQPTALPSLSAPQADGLERLTEAVGRGVLPMAEAFARVQNLARLGDGEEARLALEWCLQHFDALVDARRKVTESARQCSRADYTPIEAGHKVALYRDWTAVWPGELSAGGTQMLGELDRESRGFPGTIGRSGVLSLLEAMGSAAATDRDRVGTWLTWANVLSRGVKPEDIAAARELYQRVVESSAGSPEATAAARGIWRGEHLAVGRTAPDFVSQDHAGNEIRLSDFRGQIVVVHFWQHGEDQSAEEEALEVLRMLTQRYWDDPFVFVGINADAGAGQHRLRWTEHGVNWHEPYEPQSKDGARAKWRIDHWPSTFVLDERGTVRAQGLCLFQLEKALKPLVTRRAQAIRDSLESGEDPGSF